MSGLIESAIGIVETIWPTVAGFVGFAISAHFNQKHSAARERAAALVRSEARDDAAVIRAEIRSDTTRVRKEKLAEDDEMSRKASAEALLDSAADLVSESMALIATWRRAPDSTSARDANVAQLLSIAEKAVSIESALIISGMTPVSQKFEGFVYWFQEAAAGDSPPDEMKERSIKSEAIDVWSAIALAKGNGPA